MKILRSFALVALLIVVFTFGQNIVSNNYTTLAQSSMDTYEQYSSTNASLIGLERNAFVWVGMVGVVSALGIRIVSKYRKL